MQEYTNISLEKIISDRFYGKAEEIDLNGQGKYGQGNLIRVVSLLSSHAGFVMVIARAELTLSSSEELFSAAQKSDLSLGTGHWEYDLGGSRVPLFRVAAGQLLSLGHHALDWDCVLRYLVRYTRATRDELRGITAHREDLLSGLSGADRGAAKLSSQAIREATKLGLVVDLEQLMAGRKDKLCFHQDRSLPHPPKLLAFSMVEILSEVKKRRREWASLRSWIPSPEGVPIRVSSSNGGAISASLSTVLDKGCSLTEIARLTRRDVLSVAKTFARLVHQNVVTFPGLAASSTSATVAQPEARPLKSPTIVCVDDSPAVGKEISRLLASQGAHVISITEPLKAMKELPTIKPDLILMDLNMPGINGLKLCKMLRRHPVLSQTPIILATAYPNIGLDLEGTDVIRKPFQKQEVYQKVLHHLR